jgi:hypothetical protein
VAEGARGVNSLALRFTTSFAPNERHVAEGRRDSYCLYVVTNCSSDPALQSPIKNPARFRWHEDITVDHYYLSVDALTQPMQARDQPDLYDGKTP